MSTEGKAPATTRNRLRSNPRTLGLLCLTWLFLRPEPLLLMAEQQHAEESRLLRSSRWITPVKLLPIATPKGPSVKLEYGAPCLAEAGARLRKLVHHFGQRGSVLVRYQTPYTATGESCSNGALFFLPEQEFIHALPS